jgi:hypothetical protein
VNSFRNHLGRDSSSCIFGVDMSVLKTPSPKAAFQDGVPGHGSHKFLVKAKTLGAD